MYAIRSYYDQHQKQDHGQNRAPFLSFGEKPENNELDVLGNDGPTGAFDVPAGRGRTVPEAVYKGPFV